jgi:catechol 2,3-dioxygenase-like lactoylglutathione lyase family enzyme
VHLNVSDLEAHKRMWVELWDGELVEAEPYTAIRWPGLLLVLHEQAPTGGSQGTVMDHFGFKVRSTSGMLDRWRSAGHAVQSEFTGAEGFPNAYVVMPDEVRLELQEDPTLPVDVIGYHVHWNTPGFDSVLGWYEEMFGLTRRTRGTIETTTDVPGMNMSFGNSQESRPGSRGRSIDRIGFEVADLAALVERLEALGVTFDGPERRDATNGVRSRTFTDPSGVVVELTQGLDALFR